MTFYGSIRKRTKRKRPCHDPFGYACASVLRPDAPKLSPLISEAQTVAASISAATPTHRLRDNGKIFTPRIISKIAFQN
jgi:hypothetical protein